MNTKKLLILVGGLIVVLIGFALVFTGFGTLIRGDRGSDIGSQSGDIVSFEECARAGYPILESFPRQCRAPDGTTFIEGGSVFSGDTDVGGASGIQTSAGPLDLQYEDGFLRLKGTLQRNSSCINWKVDTQTDGRRQAESVTFNVFSERMGELCTQVISQQQLSTLVQATRDAEVTLMFEGEVLLKGRIDAN